MKMLKIVLLILSAARVGCDVVGDDLVADIADNSCERYTKKIEIRYNKTQHGCHKTDKIICNSLDEALNGFDLNDTCINILHPNPSLKNASTIWNTRNFKLFSTNLIPPSISCYSYNNSGLHFYASTNITLFNVAFSNCSAPLKMTGSWQNVYLPTTLGFINSFNIDFEYLQFTLNYGYSVVISDSSQVRISHSTFSSGQEGEVYRDGKPMCRITGGIVARYTREIFSPSLHDLVISQSHFLSVHKKDLDEKSDKFVTSLQLRDAYTMCGKGSGIGIYFLDASVNNTVVIDNSTFKNNIGDFGGAVFVGMQYEVSSNKLTVNNSHFHKNRAKEIGGAIHVQNNSPSTNYIQLEQCRFSGNNATTGGAVSFMFLTVSDINARSSLFNVKQSTFERNSAKTGGSFYFQNIEAHLQSVNVSHSNMYKQSGQGGLYSLRSRVTFSGSNYFERNNNTALVLQSTEVHNIDGDMNFIGNKGELGGAMAFYEHSQFTLSGRTIVTFENNRAASRGGAIYVSTPGPPIVPMESSELTFYKCFLVLDNYTGLITFENNTSDEQQNYDVFATSLQNCKERRQTIFDNHPSSFNFVGGNPRISTDPVKILNLKDENWKVYPGQYFSAEIHLVDERNNSVGGSVKVDVGGSNVNVMHSNTFYIEVTNEKGNCNVNSSRNNIKSQIKLSLKGKTNTTFQVIVSTATGIPLRTKTKGTLKNCPFGTIWKDYDDICSCDSVNNTKKRIAQCSNDKLYLLPNTWVYKENKSFVCPVGYCKEPDKDNRYVLYIENENEDKQCNETRTGLLCSNCKQGLSAAMGTEKCIKCNNSKGYISVTIIIMAGLSLFIGLLMLLDIDIMSYNINISMYSYQILDTLYTQDQRSDKFLDFIRSIFQYTGSLDLYPTACLWDGMNSMQKCAYGYVIPIWMLLLMFILYHCHFKWPMYVSLKRWYKAFSIVIVMCFSDIIRTSFELLHYVDMNEDGYRLYIYAEVKYFKGKHLPYAITALCLLLIVLFFSVSSTYLIFKKNPFGKSMDWLRKLQEKIDEHFRENRRWFWLFYMLCRLLIYGVGIFTQKDDKQLTVLPILCFIIMTVVAISQPYNNKTLNHVETVVLLILTFISVSSLGENQYFKKYQNFYDLFIHILSYVPLLAIVFSILLPIFCKMKNDRKGMSRSLSSNPPPLRVFDNLNFQSDYTPHAD